MSHHVCKKLILKNLFIEEEKKNNGTIFRIAYIYSRVDSRERLPTIEEDYQSSIELIQPINTTNTRYPRGLFYFFVKRDLEKFYFA
jgi:hypothetical protein